MTICQVRRLGIIPYLEAWKLQSDLAAARGRDEIPDTLLLLEHPHTYTLGSSAHAENLIWSAEQRTARGVTLHQVDRGGDVTYHGPGQLVGYPILKLPRGVDGLHTDVIGYVRALEQMLIAALATFEVRAFPVEKLTGVWVEPLAKIAAIGVKVTTKAVTLHGFALNVNTDLSYFEGIIPCGIADKPVTSLAARFGAPIDFDAVSARVITAFGETLAREMVLSSERTVSVGRV